MPSHVVDMIEELKLRRWARLNHRRLTEPDDSLHPIILEELHSIECEYGVAEPAHSNTVDSNSNSYDGPASSSRRLDENQGGSVPAPNLETAFRNTEYFVHG